MKKKRGTSTNIAIILPLLAVIVAIIAFTTVYLKLKPDSNKEIDVVGTTNTTVISQPKANKDDAATADYVGETNYKGNLSQFPDLYQIPFKKSEAYICNKDFSMQHSDTFEECETKATEFMEALFNVDYREIVQDKTEYSANVATNCDYTAPVTLNWDTDEEQTIDFYSYILKINDYFAQNMVQMDAKFYTDDSLVYSDFYTFVRGELVFTIYSSEDNESEFEIGKEYQIPMEIALQRTSFNPNVRTIVSFGRATDNTFFLNP